jgi:hypothetical protein
MGQTVSTTNTSPQPGDFSWVEDDRSRTNLECAYRQLANLPKSADVWNQLRALPDASVFVLNEPVVDLVHREQFCTGGCGHSGSSFRWTLNNMKAIAQVGWDAWYAQTDITKIKQQ